MQSSYAVTWKQGAEPTQSGRLELLSTGLALDGAGANGSSSQIVEFGDLCDVHVGRSAADRMSGRATLVLEPRTGEPIRIASIVDPGVISELAERLARKLREERAMSRAVVVLPLKEGMSAQAAEMLHRGPPFDPSKVGLARHQVFLTDDEVVFLFEAHDLDAAERLVGDQSFWKAAVAWRDLVAGPPRIADDAYSWERPRLPDDLSFAPTPGQGDSEGGDLGSPGQ